mgnify:CR=1 FL=1
MPRKIKDLAVKTGSYTDRNGETKNRYENVGSILQMDDGSKMMLLKRSFNPAGVPFREGSDQIVISLFDPKEKDGSGGFVPANPAPAAPASPAVDFDSDIPF